MKKNLTFLASCIIFLIFDLHALKAQTISGQVTISDGKPLQYVNILLRQLPDSALVKGTITNSLGNFKLENIKHGTFFITYSYSGFERKNSAAFEISNSNNEIKLEAVKLLEDNKQLKQVTITAVKPLFEQKIDRMIINVKGSITDAGGSALDVLEKSPGVLVNKQNNSISILGKSGVNVMINGKLTQMPMDAVMQLLAGTSAGNIEKIELITTPPAKYDAEGNAGYINIVMINSQNVGLNGSYFLTAGYGKRELPSAGFNFNYRKGKVNIYGNYSFTRDHQLQDWDNFRQIGSTGNTISNTTTTNRDGISQVNNLRLGLDYEVDSCNIIGLLLSGYNSNWTMTSNNKGVQTKNNLVDTTVTLLDNELNHWQNVSTNLNYQHTFKPGKTLYLDANYIYFNDNNPNTYFNNYYNGANTFLFQQNTRTGKITPFNFEIFAIDYTTPIGKKITLETGAKALLHNYTNDISAESQNGSIWITDQSLSANYTSKENIQAAYASFTANVTSNFILKAGLRYEHTYSNLSTTTTPNIVDRDYGEYFPTFYASEKINDKNSINLSYSRRITRPKFNDLAPFTIFLDPKTFITGNPALQPAIANSIQVNYLLKDFIFSLSFTHEENSIENFQNKIDTLNNKQFISSYNFKYTQFVTASVSLPFTINTWWSMQNNFAINHLKIYNVANGLLFNSLSFNYNLNTTQRFTLPNDYSIEATAYYYSDQYFGTQKLDPIYQIDLGMQKKLKNKKDIFRLAATDLLNTGTQFNFVDYSNLKNSYISGKGNFGLIAFKFTYTHNFGNTKLKDNRNRITGADDDLHRVHN